MCPLTLDILPSPRAKLGLWRRHLCAGRRSLFLCGTKLSEGSALLARGSGWAPVFLRRKHKESEEGKRGREGLTTRLAGPTVTVRYSGGWLRIQVECSGVGVWTAPALIVTQTGLSNRKVKTSDCGQPMKRPCGRGGRNSAGGGWPEKQEEVLALRALVRWEQVCPHSHECPFTPFLPALCCLCTHSFCSSRGASWSPWGNRRKSGNSRPQRECLNTDYLGTVFYF